MKLWRPGHINKIYRLLIVTTGTSIKGTEHLTTRVRIRLCDEVECKFRYNKDMAFSQSICNGMYTSTYFLPWLKHRPNSRTNGIHDYLLNCCHIVELLIQII